MMSMSVESVIAVREIDNALCRLCHRCPVCKLAISATCRIVKNFFMNAEIFFHLC